MSIQIIGVLFLYFSYVNSAKKRISNELKLTRDILSKYENIGIIGRPVADTKKEINISIGLDLIQILELDENRQILKTNCWLNYKWNDNFLVWDPKNYSNLDVLRVFSNQIWTPDLKLYNFADERLNEHRDARVIVKSSGEVLWVPTALYKTTCPVDLIFFPFDHHYCYLEFGSWTYDAEKLWLIWKEGNDFVDLSSYMQSNEWAIQQNHNETKSKMIKQKRSIKVAKDVVTKEFNLVRFILHLKRNPSFYIFTLLVPSALLSTLTLVVFWLPPESPAKMMFGVNIFIAFFVLLCLLSSSVPRSVKNFPLIGSYFCLNMCMITVSTFISTWVINLYYKDSQDNMKPPRWMRKIFIEIIGQKMGLCKIDRRENICYSAYVDSSDLQKQEDSSNGKMKNQGTLRDKVDTIKRLVIAYAGILDKKNKESYITSEWRILAIAIDRTFFLVYVGVILSCLLIAFTMSSRIEEYGNDFID